MSSGARYRYHRSREQMAIDAAENALSPRILSLSVQRSSSCEQPSQTVDRVACLGRFPAKLLSYLGFISPIAHTGGMRLAGEAHHSSTGLRSSLMLAFRPREQQADTVIIANASMSGWRRPCLIPRLLASRGDRTASSGERVGSGS